MKKLFKRFNYRHIVCFIITAIFVLLSVFVFSDAFKRICESGVDIKNSFLYYLCNLLDLDYSGEITVLNFSSVKVSMPFNLPDTWEEFQAVWNNYWNLWASDKNFIAYLDKIGDILYYLSRFLLLVVPIILIFVSFKLIRGQAQNNDYNKDSKPLKLYKKLEKRLFKPIGKWCKDLFLFVKSHTFWVKIWFFIWAYNFNFISILIEFFAFYFYFVFSFDLVGIYIQFVKLLTDLCPMLTFVPIPVWIVLALVIIDKIRKNIAYKRLNHFEMQDRGFINERPIVLMICGTMGKKKTTMITDIALSQEIMFRDKAFEMILECDLKFPFFPWIVFENSLKKAIDNHSVYNLATCKRFVLSKQKKFERKKRKKDIFGYDYMSYGLDYDNKLSVCSLWQVLTDYAQLYFIYIIESSLLLSNYSIRVDNVLDSIGNFPLWNSELFRKDSRLIESFSRHSHILDFDSLRLGKKILNDGKYKDSFEFGVINITEIGKERCNNLELQEIKKGSEFANQKNDLFNSWLKLVRHSATVCNYPFVKIIVDEQRPESWGADARDLCEIVHIDNCSDLTLAMPLFSLGELFYNWWDSKFSAKYYDYRFNRGDNTLFMYLYHGLSAKFYKYYSNIYNTFGFYRLNCSVESGRQDGEYKESNYFLMSKKIYSKRFSTDCFSDYFNEKSLRSTVGLNDIAEYKTEKATFDELLKENSYFFNDLIKLKNKDSENKR